jgi:hypothetical protein
MSFELLSENTIPFYKAVDDRLLMAVKPTGQCDYEEVEELYNVIHCANRLSVIFFDNNIILLFRLFAPYEEWQMKKAQKAP